MKVVSSEAWPWVLRTPVGCLKIQSVDVALRDGRRNYIAALYEATPTAKFTPPDPTRRDATVQSRCFGSGSVNWIRDDSRLPLTKQEAQLSPSDRAMRLVSSNLANYHATVQKLLIRQVLPKPMVWSWRFSSRQCVTNKPTTVELCISPVYRRLAVAKFSKSTM